MYTALLSSNPLFISFTKTFTKPERFQSHRLSVVSVLGCTWYTTIVILYILDSAFLCLKNEQTGAGRDDRTCLARPNGTNGKGKNKKKSCSAYHELDRQPYPVDIFSAYTRT